jgi:hypothetical protein
MTIKKSQAIQYPRVSDWYETDCVEHVEYSNWDSWNIEVVYYEADAEYSYGSNQKQIIKGGYTKASVLDRKANKAYSNEFLGETASSDLERWVNDILNEIKYRSK